MSSLLVGITGGIGSGKSTVSKLFEVLGTPVYYADDRAKILMSENAELIDAIKSSFGEESYLRGELNRPFLAAEVFSNPERLEVLNKLVHPIVAKDFTQWAKEFDSKPYVLKEAALLFESGSYEQLDYTICVMANKAIRTERVLLRDDQRSLEEIHHIMDRQTSDGVRKKLANFLIDNSGNILLIPQVIKLHQQLLELSL